MKKLDLIRHVASEGAKLKELIIDALAEDDPQSFITSSAVSEVFAELNEIIQSANISNTK